MSLIQIKNLTFCYDGSYDNIFTDVSLQLDTDWRLGLVGRNGKGKTTLLKILAGELSYRGEINASVKFEYFPYKIDSNLPENVCTMQVIESINPDCEPWQIKKEMSLLELSDDILWREFSLLSKGEQTKVLLAVMFTKENSFLLIDEPTNHLDMTGRKLLSDYLKKKSSYIIISHDRTFMDNCVDRVLSINRANIEMQNGNLSSYLENKRTRDESERAQDDILKTEIARLGEAKKRAANWSDKVEATKYGGKQSKSGLRPDRGAIGAKAAKMMKRAKAIEGRIENTIEEKANLLKNTERIDSLTVTSLPYKSERLISARDFVVRYGDKIVSVPLTFEVNLGDRLAITGKNGCGKSSIIKAITGSYTDFGGELNVGSNLKISYVSQDTSFMRGSLDEFCNEYEVEKTTVFTFLAKLGLNKTQFDKKIEDFSEGQKKKLLIAKSLSERAHLYIWDEPLNYIDVISRQQIQELILCGKPTMIFVEHDKIFCDAVATSQIIL